MNVIGWLVRWGEKMVMTLALTLLFTHTTLDFYLKAGAKRDGCHVEGVVGVRVSREFAELLESMEFEST